MEKGIGKHVRGSFPAFLNNAIRHQKARDEKFLFFSIDDISLKICKPSLRISTQKHMQFNH